MRIERSLSPCSLGHEPLEQSAQGTSSSTGASRALSLPIPEPPEVKEATAMLLASGSSDPIEALMGVLHQLRAASGDRAERDVRAAESRQESARLTHEKAIADAKAAAESRMKGAPRWIKALVSAIVTAVGVVAAAFTGGASLGLAIAGAVLLLSADGLAKLGQKLGMSEGAAKWLKLGLQAAGSVMMLGAGLAGSAATALPKAMEVTQKAVKVVKGAMDAVEHSIGLVDAERAHRQAEAEGAVSMGELGVERASDDQARAITLLSEGLERMRRDAEAVGSMLERAHQTSEVLASGGAR